MSSIIKNFDDFQNEKGLDESNMFSSLFSKATTAVTDVITTKITAYLLNLLGISEKSIFSTLVQEFIEQIPIKDYITVFFGRKVDSNYLAPKAADATMEFLTREGFDGIAKNLGIEEDGFIYRTITEMISNEVKSKEFREKLEKFYFEAFNTFGFGGEFIDTFSRTEKTKVANEFQKLASKQAEEIKGSSSQDQNQGYADNLINSFFGGSSTNVGAFATTR